MSATTAPRAAARVLVLTVLALLASLLAVPAASADAGAEAEFVAKLNDLRQSRGLAPLRVTADLTEAARAHTGDMASSATLYHNPELATDVTGWLRVSENVGYGGSVQSIHDALVDSEGHLRNMLDSTVTQVGIGTAWTGTRLWVTQVFRRPDASKVNAPGLAPVQQSAPAPAPAPTYSMADLGLAACPSSVPSAGFADLPAGTLAKAAVDCAVWWDLVKGVTASRFSPDSEITRGQAASLLARQLAQAGRLPSSPRDRFTDDDGNVHEDAINALAELGVISGSPDGTFAPNAPLRRDQMASYLVRTQEVLLGALPAQAVPFTDLAGNPHAANIAKAYTAGLTKGASATSYHPGGTLPRRQMAAFLVRAVDDLLAAGLVSRPA